MLAGIGSTMVLSMTGFAFEGTLLQVAKLGILAASIISAAGGLPALLGGDGGHRNCAAGSANVPERIGQRRRAGWPRPGWLCPSGSTPPVQYPIRTRSIAVRPVAQAPVCTLRSNAEIDHRGTTGQLHGKAGRIPHPASPLSGRKARHPPHIGFLKTVLNEHAGITRCPLCSRLLRPGTIVSQVAAPGARVLQNGLPLEPGRRFIDEEYGERRSAVRLFSICEMRWRPEPSIGSTSIRRIGWPTAMLIRSSGSTSSGVSGSRSCFSTGRSACRRRTTCCFRCKAWWIPAPESAPEMISRRQWPHGVAARGGRMGPNPAPARRYAAWHSGGPARTPSGARDRPSRGRPNDAHCRYCVISSEEL